MEVGREAAATVHCNIPVNCARRLISPRIDGFKSMRISGKNRVLKNSLSGVQKGSVARREKSTSGGVLAQYVGARRLSATKQMSLFQQPEKI
jgi:hypothetical protein